MSLVAENCLEKLQEKLRIKPEILEILSSKRAILAFSHGSDSTALFYTLLSLGVKFSVAFVNYKTRENSDIEMISARNLCEKFDVKFHCLISPLNFKNSGNFEKKAREIRWNFFAELCQNFGYNAVLTAHQLNDKFEWFLMQLSKGSGLANLLSPQLIEKRENFVILRPLLDTPKAEILKFLTANKIEFFKDISNENLAFKRNFIRAYFSDKFIDLFGKNLAKSFEFLELDKELLMPKFLYENGEFFVLKKCETAINAVDKACKILGVILNQNQRKEIVKTRNCVISGTICICENENFIFISPYKKQPKMEKSFKEKCRILKIPPLLRGYIYEKQEILEIFTQIKKA